MVNTSCKLSVTKWHYCLLLLGLIYAAPALSLEKVSLQLKWKHQFQFAGYYAAAQKGFYAEEGLEVNIREVSSTSNHIQAVINGDAEYGISDSSIILYRLQGDPIVVLAPIFQHSPLVLITKASDNILGPIALKGKRVMWLKGVEAASITAMFYQSGLKLEDIIHVPLTLNSDVLMKGDADAMSAYITDQPFYYKENSVALNILNPSNYGIDFYGDTLFTTEAEIKSHPERARRFLRASLKGWEYALQHKDETINWIINKYGSTKSVKQLKYEADATENMIRPDLIEIGHLNLNRFNRVADIYRKLKMAPLASKIDGIDANDYLSENKPVPQWIWWILVFSIIILIISFILLAINRRLKVLVEQRTQEVKEQNKILEKTVLERTIELKEAKEIAETERDKATRASIEKSDFLAHMSHEIRTPLNGVLGMAKIGRRETQEPESEKRFSQVLDSGQYLLGVINDILDVSKIEAGKLNIVSKPLQLMDMVEGITNMLAERAEDKGFKLTVNFAHDLPVWVKSDSLRLQQILLNLLSNAIKFTSTGDVLVSVTRDAGTIHFKVRDTGIGLNEEQISRLFMPFEQADSSTTRKYGGTGLGLAISQNLAQLMGGNISVESRVNKGSIFTLSLPLVETKAADIKASVTEEMVAEPQLKGLRVLAAEDVEINRLILEDLLIHEGASVVFAEDGQQAIDRLDNMGVDEIDIVLMDIQMPVMDGYEATRRILDMRPGLPVIGVTAHALKDEQDKCFSAGMVGHVTKPIEIEDLIATIKQHFDRGLRA